MYKVISLIGLSILLSCSGDKSLRDPSDTISTSQVLTESTSKTLSYDRKGDLISDLYQELVDKDSTLNRLEADIRHNNDQGNVLDNRFNAYASKSNSYYQTATYNAAEQISDSIYRKRITALIEASKKRYENLTVELDTLQRFISRNNTKIRDHHAALKIILTLPVIEKYQRNHLPKTAAYKEHVKTQEQLIRRIDHQMSK